jgi:hypothetical protein
MTVQPFEINIEPAVLDDLRNQLRGTRWPDEIDSAGWDYGMNGSVLRSFVHTWAEEFDWPAQQIRLNQYPHLRVDVDGLGVHALHARAVDGAGLPLVLLHGWPSSFVQMLPIVPLLTTGADPFDVVVISLPGYGFSDRPRQRGMNLTRIAEIVVEVMDRLGYSRFGARGSDLSAPRAGTPVPPGEPTARFTGQGARWAKAANTAEGWLPRFQYVNRIEEPYGARSIRHWRRAPRERCIVINDLL